MPLYLQQPLAHLPQAERKSRRKRRPPPALDADYEDPKPRRRKAGAGDRPGGRRQQPCLSCGTAPALGLLKPHANSAISWYFSLVKTDVNRSEMPLSTR